MEGMDDRMHTRCTNLDNSMDIMHTKSYSRTDIHGRGMDAVSELQLLSVCVCVCV